MNFVDLILILVALVGIYIGWCAGFFKALVDSILFFISTIVASILSKIIVSPLYGMLPFLNFSGKAQGIKSINIMFYRVVIHVLIIFILVAVFNKISAKIKLKEKLVNSMVEINFISRIFGVIFFVPAIIVFIFNALLVLHLPIFNIKAFHESKISSIVMEKTPVLAGMNKNLYDSEKYAVEAMAEENTKETFSEINDNIIDNLIENELVSEDVIEKLRDSNKLLGSREKDKIETDIDDSDSSDDDWSDDGDFEDDGSFEDDGYYEDDGSFEDDGYYEDDGSFEDDVYYEDDGYYEDELLDDEEMYFE